MSAINVRMPSSEELHAARVNVGREAVRTPLIRLNVDAPAEIYLKLENLQPIASFKIRGAANVMLSADPADLARGVYTVSAGNMAQGVSWMGRKLGVQATVIMPEHAPRTKVERVEALGGIVRKVSLDTWTRVFIEHGYDGVEGVFVHPVSDTRVIAGNATAGTEILEDLPDVDDVFVPFGGGGLSCGIAAALRAAGSAARVWASESDNGAPFAAALADGAPVRIEYTPTFVDGIGSRQVLPEMWPIAQELLAGSRVVAVSDAARAVKLLVERARIVAEGAAGTAVAAALQHARPGSKIVAVISGGNIDTKVLARILNDEPPQ